AVASVPASVTVPAGATSATFTVTTPVVMGLIAQSDIIATFGGVSRAATLTVTPSTAACTPTTCAAQGKTCGTILDGCGGSLVCGSCTAPQTCGGGGIANVCGLTPAPASTAVLTVTATGRAGESISSTPIGLKVNVGTSGSASFTTGTSVTLTVSNGRDAIWSGGCSSGGAKVKSCTVTINAATSSVTRKSALVAILIVLSAVFAFTAEAQPPAPTVVAPAAGAALIQPITLSWNAVVDPAGPIGSYTWEVSNTSTFGVIIASGF